MTNRTKYQGVLNIMRFNWPFYVGGLCVVAALGEIGIILLQPLITIFSAMILVAMLISLLVSWYVYDVSGIYELNWLKGLKGEVLNINAGFDEISNLIRNRFKNVNLQVADFYDESLMTEPSIKRARAFYPLEKGTKQVNPIQLNIGGEYDRIILFFAAHEIRNEKDRGEFFKELNRITSHHGEVYIVEHLRDWKNFLAYTIGFFHFYSNSTWNTTFMTGGFKLKSEEKLTPFVSLFKLEKHGITS